METTIEQSAVNMLRVLACEAISKAGSGHSGIALGAAPIMYSIYENLNVDCADPSWFNRDRFVLSAGHGSALLYSTLKCFGFGGIDLKTFRQLGSKLTGHPELDEDIGVDCSTGPLGQGVAMAVGIAAAEKKLAAMFNKKDGGNEISIIDHYTFCLCGDGCLMEGVSYEACSLAGLWRLNKLVLLYDSNEITLDGERKISCTEDIVRRFKAMRWNVLLVNRNKGENTVSSCIGQAKASGDAPTLIIVETEIGCGAKNAGTNKAHGQVLTADEVRELRLKWGFSSDAFCVDKEVEKHFKKIILKKTGLAKEWEKNLVRYKKAFPDQFKALSEFINKPRAVFNCTAEDNNMALRDAGGQMLNQIARQNPRLWGGSADVASTTKAFIHDGGFFSCDKPNGANIAFGVREFAMAAITNGIALHGFTPFCSTFLAFSDYCKPALRLGAMMNLPVTYIFSHDGLGNAPDGSTHQAAEHIAALRLVPNIKVFRPADNYETADTYKTVFEEQVPACIVLGRSNVPNPCGAGDGSKNPCAVLLSSGSEVALCAQAQKILSEKNVSVNVISVPCLEMFDSGRFDRNVPVVAVEMGSGLPWWAIFGKYGIRGDVISFDTFGDTGSNAAVMEKLGFTAENIAKKVLKLIKR